MAKSNLLGSENILEYPNQDFIPYACYIDKTTILTKNSDLLITFKIPSFISNKAKAELFDIRETFRLLIYSTFKSQNVSFYFTTVRKKADIIPFGEVNNYFSKEVSDIWNKQSSWNKQFVNEIYITVIVSPNEHDSIFNPLYFLTSLTQFGISSMYSGRIEKLHKKLKKLTSIIFEKMADYDIKLLSMVEGSDGILYSEHMRFFSLLVNLEKGKFPITYDNISDVIRTKKMAYGYDVIEVDKNGNKKFASIFTIKSFQDLTLTQLDKIIQLPMELIITETENFTDNKFVVSKYEEQKEMIGLSEDVDLAYISGLDSLVTNNTGKNTDYCIGQTTIMVMNKTQADLTIDIKNLYKSLDEIGLVAVKENVFMPTIFWSQLPGNFRYIKRFHITPTVKIGNYLSLFSFPTGKLRYNYWGNAITIIPTAINTPYFFNFHNGNNGNTLIVGLPDTGKTTIMNFLLSQTSKINPKIFYIDTSRSSEIFINAMGGKYYKVSPANENKEEQFKINPFLLENTPDNQKFLNEFIISLVDFQDDGFIEMGKEKTALKYEYEKIPEIVKQIFSINVSERSFEKVASLFDNPETKNTYNKLVVWYKNEKISFIFNHDNNIDFNSNIIGVSLRTIIGNINLTIPVVSYIFNLIKNIANGDPFILAIDDAWRIVDNKIIAPQFIDALINLPQKNVAMLVTTDGISKLSESFLNEEIVEHFGTEIYLANPKLTTYQKKVFGLQEEEGRILSLMKLEDRNFLLKCINDIIISSINLKSDFGNYVKIFSDDNVSINAMKKAKDLVNSENPELWIPVFLKIIDEYEKTLKLKKLKENEINQLKWEEARADQNSRNKIVKND